MNCDICNRAHDAQRRPFLCAVDARNRCYDGRVRNLQLLLESEHLQSEIQTMLADERSPELLTARRKEAEARTVQIFREADKLKEAIAGAKADIAARKTAIDRRKSDLASANNGIAARREYRQKVLESAVENANAELNRCSELTASTRAFLCVEAAKLYGLARSKKDGSAGEYDYQLGQVPIVDLSSMNTLPPELISTSLAHIAHIVMLASHYLAIRLPAEITLPHRDYPRPTIFNLQSSYQHGDVPFPGSSAIPNFNEGRDASYVPRPRPLYLDKQLSLLARDDPTAYKMFLEGVTLLAYNVAWLCAVQGVPVGARSSFEEICNLGRNLYNLLIGGQDSESETTTTTTIAKPNNPRASANSDSNSGERENGKTTAPLMGRWSHGTTKNFLGGAEGVEFIKTFKLMTPKSLADRLKSLLLSNTGPSEAWEMLDNDTWVVEEEEGVIVGKKAHRVPNGAAPTTGSGASGWMRVRGR